jgi:hypothetical protein
VSLWGGTRRSKIAVNVATAVEHVNSRNVRPEKIYTLLRIKQIANCFRKVQSLSEIAVCIPWCRILLQKLIVTASSNALLPDVFPFSFMSFINISWGLHLY